MSSPLISGIRTAEDILRADLERRQHEAENPVPPPSPLPAPAPVPGTAGAASLADYLALSNLSCIDADGKEFEKYDQLLVRKDIFRDQRGQQQSFTPYNAAVYCEQQGLFLPSFALSCNILAALYQNRTNSDINHVLMQYKDKGNGYGWHGQNTLINYGTENIVHYPSDGDFPTNGGTKNINALYARRELPFKKLEKSKLLGRAKILQTVDLEAGLHDPLISRFVRQLTGLADPSVLVEIGNYFQKLAHLWFPDVTTCTETRACWLGCNVSYFLLYSLNGLYGSDAARGVRR